MILLPKQTKNGNLENLEVSLHNRKKSNQVYNRSLCFHEFFLSIWEPLFDRECPYFNKALSTHIRNSCSAILKLVLEKKLNWAEAQIKLWHSNRLESKIFSQSPSPPNAFKLFYNDIIPYEPKISILSLKLQSQSIELSKIMKFHSVWRCQQGFLLKIVIWAHNL